MSKDAPPPKARLAAEAWQMFFGFLIKTRHSRDVVLEEFKLTPVDAKAIHSLSVTGGKPMGQLAEEWACDASNVTWMVDRLEKRGLARRQTSPYDRRVKLVTLTPKGGQIKQKVMKRMMQPPSELLSLRRVELEHLRDALRKLPADETPTSLTP